MNDRCPVSQLGERDNIDQIFLVSDRQLRANRNGNLYLLMQLSDRTGTISAMLWNANESIASKFNNGDYLRVEGGTQFYNGKLQIIAKRVEPVPREEIDESEYLQRSEQDVSKLLTRLGEILRSLETPALRTLAECFLMDEDFVRGLSEAPAGIKNHHAYQGGLLEHTVNVLELVLLVAPRYPEVDRELLLMGAFLHDIGKIRELAYQRELAYTDEGQLVGHMVLGIEMLDGKIAEATNLSDEDFPRETAVRLRHMMLSHHGQYEYGSCKLPMTLEAVMLHELDHMDSRIHGVVQLMREDANVESPWTAFHPNLGRKFFKDLPSEKAME